MPIVRLSNDKSYACDERTSLLAGAEAAGLVLEHSCRTGRCSSCKARVVAGSTTALRPEEGLSAQERDEGWILTCVRSATADVQLDVADLGDITRYARRLVPCRIQSLERLAPDVLRVVLRLPPTAALGYLPGQFFDVVGTGGLRRSYSIANASGQSAGGVEIHVREVANGAMSAYWFGQVKVNDLLRLDGPLGTFFVREAPGDHLVFLATGTGIAPVKAMLEGLAASAATWRPARISVYWGGRTEQDHYWRPDATLASLDIDFVPVCSRPAADWTGARGHVQDVFLRTAPDLARTWVYACWSSQMVESATVCLTELGLPANRLHSDAFVPSN
jgi:CDP-4-dehydro-6-deoxyglucose reductase